MKTVIKTLRNTLKSEHRAGSKTNDITGNSCEIIKWYGQQDCVESMKVGLAAIGIPRTG
jgi:hypothetical protein